MPSAAKRDAGRRTAGRHGAIIANGSRPDRSEGWVGKGIRSDNIGELVGQVSRGEGEGRVPGTESGSGSEIDLEDFLMRRMALSARMVSAGW